MKILFIHQNFPGQFLNLAPAIASRGYGAVVALAARNQRKLAVWQGVEIRQYQVLGRNGLHVHPWLRDMETKTLRAEACWRAARELRSTGLVPDAIVAHPGWGEALFLKQVWPTAKLGLYAEMYYRAAGTDMGFDREFASKDPEADACRLQMKNLNHLAHLQQADAAISPTHWQADTFPEPWRDLVEVIHDGIDTSSLRPRPDVELRLSNGLTLSRKDEVITYVARHLEPYRGIHVFMRALPELLLQRPKAHVIVVGDDSVGYGAAAPAGTTWRQIYTDEVRGQISDSDWARVHFVGRLNRNDFTSLLQVSRVHVYLSYPFVLSWSLLEAMSVGCAIVASDTAPVREAISDGEHGLLVDFFDRDGLVDRISALLDDQAEREKLGVQARKRVVERYDLKSVCLPRQLDWIARLCAG